MNTPIYVPSFSECVYKALKVTLKLCFLSKCPCEVETATFGFMLICHYRHYHYIFIGVLWDTWNECIDSFIVVSQLLYCSLAQIQMSL